jgi:hypothetical protein
LDVKRYWVIKAYYIDGVMMIFGSWRSAPYGS